MTKQQPKGFTRLINAARYSRKGLIAAWHNEAAFRQEIMMLLFALPLAAWISQSFVQFCLLIYSVLMVIVVELLNSGLESVVDRISEERHELSGRAKDMGSAAVMIVLIACSLVWLGVIYSNYLYS